MTADEFCRRMYHNVSAVFDRADQIRCAERIVYNDRQTLLMRELCDGVDVRNVTVRVAERFQIHCLGVRTDGSLDFFQNMCIDEGRFNAEGFERVGQQVIGPAVYGLLANDVVALLRECLDGIGDRCRAGSNRQCSHAALECRDPLFEDALRAVGQSAVDIACVR